MKERILILRLIVDLYSYRVETQFPNCTCVRISASWYYFFAGKLLCFYRATKHSCTFAIWLLIAIAGKRLRDAAALSLNKTFERIAV